MSPFTRATTQHRTNVALQTGLLPTLTKALTEHSTLVQRTSDAAVLRAALAHISQCRTEYRKLSQFVKDGALPQAVQSRQTLQKLLDDAPKAAVKAEVMVNLKVCYIFLSLGHVLLIGFFWNRGDCVLLLIPLRNN